MTNNSFKRITPEEALKAVDKEAPKGHLKIFLGYAPGVGKTYSMLNEANRMLKRGQDIVIGYLESHGRNETNSQVASLEILPRKKINYNNMILEEIDVDEVLKRKPKIVLIDELAHTNAPGSKKGLDMLESHFKLAEQLGAETVTLTGKSVSRELVRFASQKHITQLIIGHANRTFRQMVFRGSSVTKVLRHAKDIEIHVIPDNSMFEILFIY